MADDVYFGNASGEYATVEPELPGPDLVFKHRPDQDGEDLVVFGKRGAFYTGQAVVFGTSRSAVSRQLRLWEAERGQVRTLYMTSGGARGQQSNVVLTYAAPLGRAKRIINATNSATWLQRLTLIFKQLGPDE